MTDLDKLVMANLSEATKDKLALALGGVAAAGALVYIATTAYKSSVQTKTDADIKRMKAMKDNDVTKFKSTGSTGTKSDKGGFNFADSFDAERSAGAAGLAERANAYVGSRTSAPTLTKAQRSNFEALVKQGQEAVSGKRENIKRIGKDVSDVPFKAVKGRSK